MPLAYLQVLAKGGALVGDRMPLNTDFIPRVGELIQVGKALELPSRHFQHAIVVSVVYRLQSRQLVPFVTARQGYDRQLVLEHRGWLPVSHLEEIVDRDENDLCEQLDDPEPGPPLDDEDFSLV